MPITCDVIAANATYIKAAIFRSPDTPSDQYAIGITLGDDGSAGQVPCPAEDRVEHAVGDPAGEGVLLTRVVAAQYRER
jgi:hypothetical protein